MSANIRATLAKKNCRQKLSKMAHSGHTGGGSILETIGPLFISTSGPTGRYFGHRLGSVSFYLNRSKQNAYCILVSSLTANG